MRKVRENIIASYGDQAVFSADQCVYNDDGTVAVGVGQLVFYNPRTLQSVGPTVTVAASSELVVGIGYDLDGDGVADTIRTGFGDKLYGGNIQAVTAEPASCGSPEIVDLLFKCVGCDEDLSIEVKVRDDQTENEYPYNQYAGYVETVRTTCIDCEDCDPTFDGDEAICQFVKQFNESGYKAEYGMYGYNKNRNKKANPKGFRAVQLHPTSLWYCISSASPNACDTCSHVEGIKAFTVDGVQTTLSNALDPANPTLTLRGRLKSIEKQINDVLGGDGHAIVTAGTNESCCQIQLHVNTCQAFTLIDDQDATITPCKVENPFGGINATGTLTLSANLSNTETVVIGGKTYTAQSSLTDSDGNFLIGASASDTIDNLIAAINLGTGSGSLYAASTTANTDVVATAGAGDTLVLTALTSGTPGNSVTTTETSATAAWGAATLEGGVDAFAFARECSNCSSANQVTFTNGIRFIADPVELECGVFGIDNPRGFLTRKLEVFPVSGFQSGATYVRKAQVGMEPENTGYQWLWREYAQDAGGRGRDYIPFTQTGYGLHGLPLGKGRSSNYQTAACREQYCSYVIEHSIPNKDTGVHGNMTAARGRTVILIPQGDTVTQADFEAILNNYITSVPGMTLSSVTCSSDQDQVEANCAATGFADSNGYIL